MRLLKYEKGSLVSHTFDSNPIPPYAILSHTWHKDNSQEVTFQDLEAGRVGGKAGYSKIEFCRQQAAQDGLQYFWVDTCCIDKSNNTELTEAINSMFEWYRRSSKCYVYLEDVSAFERTQEYKRRRTTWQNAFENSRWFTRGWTLQELIAPTIVEFFSKDGEYLGTKATLAQEICSITGIKEKVLQTEKISEFSISERLSWVDNRQTKRPEDKAYCLLGILGVRMRLDYGEGEGSAFARLKKKLKKLKDIRRNEAVMQWLSPVNSAAKQSDMISHKEAGTGQWFLTSTKFKAWQYEQDKTLFCPGIPGAGKTMTAAIAIDHLCKRAQNEDIGVGYLFYSYKDQVGQTSDALLAGLLKQLVQGQPDRADAAIQMHETHQKRKTRPSSNEIFSALQAVCSSYPLVYFVIDALDECPNRDGTRIRFIEKLQQLQAGANVRLMCTSRFNPEIEKSFQSSVTLEVRASEQDVRRFVEVQVPRLPKCIRSDGDLIRELQDGIAEAVNGMFLLARLYIDLLLDKRTKEQARAALQALKNGGGSLDTAYSEAIKRIEGQLALDKLLAKKALSWITYAQRPLTTKELCHALAIKSDSKKLNPDAVFDIDDVISVCAGLVTVDKESDLVRLAHYTTQEYLQQIRMVWIPSAQCDIATACLTYLAMDEFTKGPCNSNKTFEERAQDHVLLDYAAHYWVAHVRADQQAVSNIAITFLTDERLVRSTTQATFLRKYKYSDYPQINSDYTYGIHLAAMHGLIQLVGLLLEQPEHELRIDAKNSYGQTPLLLAAENGHEALVELLLDTGKVDINARDYNDQTPLSWAAKNGHGAVVKLLLDISRVDINAKNYDNQSSLLLAAKNGHEAVIKLLLNTGKIDINAKDSWGQTSLAWAAEIGHKDVVKLLLDTGKIDINTKDIWGQTPLAWATENGHEAVVKLLLDSGKVDIDAKGYNDWTPLFLAAKNGDEAVIKLLLDTGKVDVDAKDYQYWTPLSWAIGNGHEAVVKLLLDSGNVDIDAKGYNDWTPLLLAAKNGDEAVIKLLLDTNKVDINAKSYNDWTPLLLAAGYGHEAVVKLLLKSSKVDIDAKGYDDWTPRLLAAKNGHEAVVKLLLDTGKVGVDE